MSEAEAERKAVLEAEIEVINKEYDEIKCNWANYNYLRIRELKNAYWDRKLEIQTMEIKHAKRTEDMPSTRDKDNSLCLVIPKEVINKIRRQGSNDNWTLLHRIHGILVEMFEMHYTKVKATVSSFTCDSKVKITLEYDSIYDEDEIVRILLLENGTSEDEICASNIIQDILLNVPKDWKNYAWSKRTNSF
jgi:hypothetical protein